MNVFVRYKEPVAWVLLAALIKLVIWGLLYYNLKLWDSSFPFLTGGDGPMYLSTTHNIIYCNVYALFGDSCGSLEPYTGRMPGYEAILVPLQLMFGLKSSIYLVVAMQYLLASVSVYFLAKIAETVFQGKIYFFVVFIFYSINTYVAIFDVSLLTESFAVSSVVISVYIILKPTNSNFKYLIAGAFLAWAVFLRQYMAPIFIMFVIYILYNLYLKKKHLFKSLVVKIIFLVLPFIILDTIWLYRNYQVKHKFIPLVDDVHAGYKYSERFKLLMSLVQSWGGDLVHWNPKAEICFFIENNATNRTGVFYNDVSKLPSYIYTTKYNADSLVKLAKRYRLLEAHSLRKKDEIKVNEWIESSLSKYRSSFKEEKKLDYFFLAPLRLLYKFIFHSGTYNISNTGFEQQNIFQKLVKLMYEFLYWSTLILGLSGIFVSISKRFNVGVVLLSIISIYMIVLCPLILRRIEYRYLILSYPFLTVFMGFAVVQLYNILRKVIVSLKYG